MNQGFCGTRVLKCGKEANTTGKQAIGGRTESLPTLGAQKVTAMETVTSLTEHVGKRISSL